MPKPKPPRIRMSINIFETAALLVIIAAYVCICFKISLLEKGAKDKRSQEKWNHGESSSEDSKMSSGANEDLNQKDSDEYLDMCLMCILKEIVDRGPDVECKLQALVDLLKFEKRYILNRIKAYNEAIGKRREKFRDLFTRQQTQHDKDQNESSSEDKEEETDELTEYGSGDDDEGRRSKKTSGKKKCWIKRLWEKSEGQKK